MSTFFLDKIKIRLYYGHRPAGVNYTYPPPPTLGVRFAPPSPSQRVRFVRSLAAYVFYTPRLPSKNKIDRGIACCYGGGWGGPCVRAHAHISAGFFCLAFHLAEVQPALQNPKT